jgi:magnesium transporter
MELKKIAEDPLEELNKKIKSISFSRFLPKSPKKTRKFIDAAKQTEPEHRKPIKISYIDYSKTKLEEKEIKNVEEILSLKNTNTTSWINIIGIHDINLLEKISEGFGIHPLVIEDIVNATQRPKIEDYGNYLFVVMKILSLDKQTKNIEGEQLSIILGKKFIISFQEKENNLFEDVKNRIRKGRPKIRSSGQDYLLHALIDAVVDSYFVVLEEVGELIEDFEKGILENPAQTLQNDIYRLKREVLFLRKSVWPVREILASLQRNESSLIKEQTTVYFRNAYDHIVQVIDTIENFRDLLSGMLDSYLSSVSNRMNEIMKVLTIISTIFIPLTFLAGVYGMNFKYMPELDLHWFYPTLWATMVTVAILMLVYFKKKKWI